MTLHSVPPNGSPKESENQPDAVFAEPKDLKVTPHCPWCGSAPTVLFEGKPTTNPNEFIFMFWCKSCGATLGFQLRTQDSPIIQLAH